ncbi:MAG: DUF502 domain-containing protein [Gemmatimonadota bacterium]|nr:MAG: DUF502 domain-containing protein [Gemmatimonadota bacterium]
MSRAPTSQPLPRGWLAPRIQLRNRIVAGLIIALPIWITFLVVTLVFRLTRDASLWLVVAFLQSPLGTPLLDTWNLESSTLARGGLDALPLIMRWAIGLFAALLTIVLLYALGAVTANVVGRRMVRLGEALLDRVPIVKVVYQATKRVVSTFAANGKRPFKQVVLVPFPTSGIRSIGFVTKAFQDRNTGDPLYSVFVATAPNPTTGFVLVLRQSDVIELDWSIEEAVKAVMSGGVLMPDAIPLVGTRGNPTS